MTDGARDRLNDEIAGLQEQVDAISKTMQALTRRFLELSLELHEKQVELAERDKDGAGAERAKKLWKDCRGLMEMAGIVGPEMSN
jgi:hypothetical protein